MHTIDQILLEIRGACEKKQSFITLQKPNAKTLEMLEQLGFTVAFDTPGVAIVAWQDNKAMSFAQTKVLHRC